MKEGPRLSSHTCPAGFFAAAAGVGALLAMLHVRVLGALVAAGFADVGAQAQQMLGMVRAAGHEAGRQGADIGAVTVELDAAHHHFNIIFLQAGSGTMLARGYAGIEGVEQGLIFRCLGSKLG